MMVVRDSIARRVNASDDGNEGNSRQTPPQQKPAFVDEAQAADADVAALESHLAAMSDEERRHFENLLTLRAYVRGWTGDPLCQPFDSVSAAFRQMRQERGLDLHDDATGAH